MRYTYAVKLLAIVAIGGVSGTLARTYIRDYRAERRFAGMSVALPPGTVLPSGILHGVDAESEPLERIVERHEVTLLVLFTPGCTSCVGEARKWQELADADGTMSFVGVGVGFDADGIRDLRAKAALTALIYQADPALVKALVPGSLPTAYIVERSGLIRFAAAGPDATINLTRMLERRKEAGAAGVSGVPSREAEAGGRAG